MMSFLQTFLRLFKRDTASNCATSTQSPDGIFFRYSLYMSMVSEYFSSSKATCAELKITSRQRLLDFEIYLKIVLASERRP